MAENSVPKTFRQGDLLFVQVFRSEADNGTPIPRENGRIVLARGESTGHAHVVTAEAVRFVQVADVRLLVSARPFAVTHEEHKAVALPAGTFKVIQQREYAPERPRLVAD